MGPRDTAKARARRTATPAMPAAKAPTFDAFGLRDEWAEMRSVASGVFKLMPKPSDLVMPNASRPARRGR